jgi:hypothetical protein
MGAGDPGPMSAVSPIADKLLQCRDCPLSADFVAKVGEEQLLGNNRIGASSFLNQHCASVPHFESILLA